GDADSAVIVDGIRSVMNMQAESFTHEYLLELPGGQCWFLMKVNRFKGDGPLRVIISNEDITSRKLAEAEMKKARNMAEDVSLAKSDFIAGMSHEIRNPMNSIVGMADMLSNTALTDEQRKYVQLLHTASETLLDLINDVLDLSKIESGHLVLEEINFNLLDLVEKVCDVMAIRAHQKNIELYYRIDPDVKVSVIGDPLRLRQVLFNLVGNAIKFTERGHIVLNIEKDDLSMEDNALIFSVSDTGIGIEKEKVPLLFQKYSQADSAIARKYGGTGLGLAISKNLVEIMGGDIRVKSAIGQGSSFYFNLRFKVAPHSRKLSEVFNMDFAGLKILIIDENQAGAAILSETLSRCKATVKSISAIDKAVLELAKAKESGKPYDITFVDSRISLDEKERERAYKNFGEAAWYIKEKQQLTREVIMMLTTKRMASDIEYCREKKISAYIVKPFKHSELFEAISAAVGGLGIVVRNISVLQKNIIVRPAGEKIKILLVEDSDTNRLLAQTYLKDLNFEIDTAENGKIALDMATARRYDLILMDMNMPVMDGRTATGFIRGHEKESGSSPAKIIALTADVFKEDIDRCLRSGCDAYLAKPIKKSKLIETIFDHLSGDVVKSEKI
ncbi:MAG TPA: ATP-binding protein, partial [Candidatus Wallbacteria bacterium]|nr:ATP-binding protein [Candidatus Wallbacteria bacterium]